MTEIPTTKTPEQKTVSYDATNHGLHISYSPSKRYPPSITSNIQDSIESILRMDQDIADKYGYEPLGNKLSRIRARLALRRREKGDNSLNRFEPEINKSQRKYLWWVKWFYEWDGPLWELPEEMINGIIKALWFFPKEVIKGVLDQVWFKRFSEKEQKNHARVLYSSIPSEIRPNRDYSGWASAEADCSMKALYINGCLDEGSYENTWELISHEMTHLILYKASSFFEERWRRKFHEKDLEFSRYSPVYVSGAIPYWIVNVIEDMATFGQKMFSQEGWRQLREAQVKNSVMKKSVIRAKITAMMIQFERQSRGLMDRWFFKWIECGNISSPEDAQRYFQQRRQAV